MNSTSIKLKKFLSNRNTVIIVCAVVALVVLFVGYNLRVNSAINPKEIPYAKVTIQPRTKITDDMIGTINVPNAAVEEMGGDNIIISKDELIDKYSNINTMIPQGSMFYKGAVVEEEDLPDHAVYNVPKGETLYRLNVNMTTSYVNSIVPDGYIDIYISTTETGTDQIRIGKFVENIKVLAVLTSDGENVFEDSEEKRVPAYVLFSLPNDVNLSLKAAEELGFTITPVPVNASNFDQLPESSNVTSKELKEYIDNLASEFIQDGGSISTGNNNDENEE